MIPPFYILPRSPFGEQGYTTGFLIRLTFGIIGQKLFLGQLLNTINDIGEGRTMGGVLKFLPPNIGAPIKKKKKPVHRKRKNLHMPLTKRKRNKQEMIRTTNVPSRIFYDQNQSQFESDVSDSSYTRTATLRVRSKESEEELRKSSHKPP